jgi:signal transduction histidine kinase
MPHGHCYSWRPEVVWTMVVTDSLIGISYVVISATLYSFVRKTRLPFQMVFLAFGAFILACGATHFTEVYTLWVPNYWLAAVVKMITATASILTAIYLLKLYPDILDLTEAARQITQTKSRVEDFFFKRLSTPLEVKRILGKGIVLPSYLAVALIVASVLSLYYLRSAQWWIDHSNEVVKLSRELEVSATNAERDFRGYWFSGQADLLALSQESERKFDQTYHLLENLVADNPNGIEKLANVKSIFQEWRTFSIQILHETPSNGKHQENIPMFHAKDRELLRRTTEVGEVFLQSERDLRNGRSASMRQLASVLITSILLLTLILGGVFVTFGRRAISRVAESFGRALESGKMAQEKLKAALDSRDEFMSIASHELKTPLTALTLQLMLIERSGKSELKNTPFGEKLAESMLLSLRQVNSLTHLVEDLLDISSIRAGTFSLALGETNLAALVREVIKRFSEQLHVAQCTVRLDLQEHLSGRWDRHRLEQVVVNLVSNAIKYAPGRPIQITAQPMDARAILTVEDFGPGIEKDQHEKIFERFGRANSELNVQGMGLGLFIVKKIVESHGGTINVQSEIGKGSKFTVNLPFDSHASYA